MTFRRIVITASWGLMAIAGRAQNATPPSSPGAGMARQRLDDPTMQRREERQRPPGDLAYAIDLLDDVEFGIAETLRNKIRAPSELAASGLRYSGFYTTSICSPTRASLKLPKTKP